MLNGLHEIEARLPALLVDAAVMELDQVMRWTSLASAQGISTNHDYATSARLAACAIRALGGMPEAYLLDTLREYGGAKWAMEMLR